MQNFCTLKKSSDFKTIQLKGSEIKTKFLVVKFYPKEKINKNTQASKLPLLGITVSRKMGKAVKRNLIRRRIKSIFSYYSHNYQIDDMAFSFYSKKSIMYASFKELKKDVDKILKSV